MATCKLTITNPITGQTKKVLEKNVSAHTVPHIIARSAKITARAVRQMQESPQWIGTVLTSPGGPKARALIQMDGYLRVDADGLQRFIDETPLQPDAQDVLSEARKVDARDTLIRETLKERDLPGVVVEDNGVYTIYSRDEAGISYGQAIPEGVDDFVTDGIETVPGLMRTNPSWDNMARSVLGSAGVPDRDMPYFMEQFRQGHAELLGNLLDSETADAFVAASRAASEAIDDFNALASRTGMRVDAEDGAFIVRDGESRDVLARLSTAEEVEDFATRMQGGVAEELDASSPLASKVVGGGNNGGGGPPPRMNEPLPGSAGDGGGGGRNWGRMTDEEGFIPLGLNLTSFGRVSRQLFARGFGPTAKFFERTQELARAIEVERSIKMRELGGASIDEKLDLVNRMNRRVRPDRRETVSRYREALSKEEIEQAGGLMQRAMTTAELRASAVLQQLNLGDSVPQILANRRSVKNAAKQLRKADPALTSGQAFSKALDQSGLPDDMRGAIGMLDQLSKLGANKFSTFAVSAHASAPNLPKGFKTMRQAFASQHKLSKGEIALAEQLDELFNATFQLSGLKANRQLNAYLPHLRKMSKEGMTPNQFFRELPDSQWVSRMYRTGELALYEMDPFLTAVKHVRGLLISKHFDPAITELNGMLKTIGERSPFVQRIYSEYFDELIGRPHASLRALDKIIARTHKNLTGNDLDPGASRRIINGMLTMVSGSLLAFRPALLLRQYYEVLQKVIPRIGANQTFEVISGTWSREGRKALWNEAVAAGAFVPSTRRLPFGDAVLEPGTFRRLPAQFQEFIEIGLNQYRKGDDWARVVAFHAQKRQTQKAYARWQGGKINRNEFLAEGRITTFDDFDQSEFFRLLDENDSTTAFNYLGRIAAEEMIGRFGQANHPVGWGSAFGKLFGQFGTWPVQYKDFIVEGMKRGTTEDKIRFATYSAAINMATIGAFASVGLDGRGWVGYPSLSYTGGPFLDIAADWTKMMNGTPAEKALARRNLGGLFPNFEGMAQGDFRSPFLPGSFALHDLVSAFQTEPGDTAQRAFGLKALQGDETLIDLIWK